MTRTYDNKCHDLATAFVSDAPNYPNLNPHVQRDCAHELAATIQGAIESWLEENKNILGNGAREGGDGGRAVAPSPACSG